MRRGETHYFLFSRVLFRDRMAFAVAAGQETTAFSASAISLRSFAPWQPEASTLPLLLTRVEAARVGDKTGMQRLVLEGADLEKRDTVSRRRAQLTPGLLATYPFAAHLATQYGYSALMRTAINANGAPVIEVLVRGGADLEATNNVSARPSAPFSARYGPSELLLALPARAEVVRSAPRQLANHCSQPACAGW